MTDLASVTADDFEQHTGSTFRLADGGEGSELRLESVRRSGRRHEEGGREGFALLLSGSVNAPLSQGTHRLQHEQMGELEIFLVPVGVSGETFTYEAVFS